MASDFFRKKNREIQLRTFLSGEELLNYDGQIDILFLDIQMNGMDGLETARKLRAGKFRGFLIFITVLKEMVFQFWRYRLTIIWSSQWMKISLGRPWSAFTLPCKTPAKTACWCKSSLGRMRPRFRFPFPTDPLIPTHVQLFYNADLFIRSCQEYDRDSIGFSYFLTDINACPVWQRNIQQQKIIPVCPDRLICFRYGTGIIYLKTIFLKRVFQAFNQD